MVSAMGDADGKARGGFVLLDQAFKVGRRLSRSVADLPAYALWPAQAVALSPLSMYTLRTVSRAQVQLCNR